jgi:hypothetical protein
MENMNLDFLNYSKPVPGPEYQAAKIEFIGGLGYTLNTFEAYVRIDCQAGGFRIDFREPLHVPTEALLGRKVAWGYLTGIKIHTGGHTIDLGKLYPAWYPKKLRRGEVIGVLG